MLPPDFRISRSSEPGGSHDSPYGAGGRCQRSWVDGAGGPCQTNFGRNWLNAWKLGLMPWFPFHGFGYASDVCARLSSANALAFHCVFMAGLRPTRAIPCGVKGLPRAEARQFFRFRLHPSTAYDLRGVIMFSHGNLLGTVLCALLAFSAIAADSTDTDPIVGRWRWFNNRIFVFNADGTTTPNEGHWKCVSPNQIPRKYVIDWKEELNIDTLYLERSGAKLSGKNQKGRHITADRLPD